MKTKALLWTLVLLTLTLPTRGQEGAERIRLNQIGFYPAAAKVAVVVDASEGPFYLTTPDRVDTMFAGTLGAARAARLSSETVRVADFSSFDAPGTYVVDVPGVGRSHAFRIAPRVHEDVARAALKGFFYQRASTALDEAHAGRWHRPAGHPDDRVRVHASAATEARPEGTIVTAPKGWYDAGDYNKYIVNSGISTATLLSIYEDFPAYADTLGTHIPESGSAVPDVLAAALWNLRWMLAMQDPNDGGVYHKLTAPDFEGIVMPHEARSPRYVVQKSTAAALNFAAVAAQAARVFREFEDAAPGLADSCLAAAERAWIWARRHPDVVYDQNRLNENHDPDIATGAYGDRDLRDEFVWAAAELYATTRRDSFYTAVPVMPDDAIPLPSWSRVRALGYYTLARHRADLTPAAEADVEALMHHLVAYADELRGRADATAYRTAMGRNRSDFVWGSNSVAANQGIALVQAYRWTGDPAYLRAALANLDYLLGRNATGYSFVTGHGTKTPRHPHHRPSEADDVPEPVPGLLVGGPNPGQQDECDYPSDDPARSYVDAWCSYASNEIAINWNAPLAYLVVALEALQGEVGE